MTRKRKGHDNETDGHDEEERWHDGNVKGMTRKRGDAKQSLLERLILLIQFLLHDVACAAVHINSLTI